MDQKTKTAVFQITLLGHMKALQRRRQLLYQELLHSHGQLMQQLVLQRTRRRRHLLARYYSNCEMLLAERVPRLFRSIEKLIPTSSPLWTALQQPNNESLYRNTFHMSKCCFDALCEKLMQQREQPIQISALSKQVAACVYRLASNVEYRVVAEAFGIHRSTVHKYVHKIVEAINMLNEEYVKMPNEQEAWEIAEGFEQLSQVPRLMGVLGDIHIPIVVNKQLEQYEEVSAAVLLQTVVDDKYRFRHLHIEYVNDEDVSGAFKQSPLFLNGAELLPTQTKKSSSLSLVIAADNAYPLLPWLVKPYNNCLTEDERIFNAHLRKANQVADGAFARLKGRWQCLGHRVEGKAECAPKLVKACVILHNFLESIGEKYDENWSTTPQSQEERGISNEVLQMKGESPTIVREILKNSLMEKKAKRFDL